MKRAFLVRLLQLVWNKVIQVDLFWRLIGTLFIRTIYFDTRFWLWQYNLCGLDSGGSEMQ